MMLVLVENLVRTVSSTKFICPADAILGAIVTSHTHTHTHTKM